MDDSDDYRVLTVRDLFDAGISETDAAAKIDRFFQQAGAFLEGLAITLQPVFREVFEAVARIEQAAEVPGYERAVSERANHPILARMVAYFVINASAEEIERAPMLRQAADGIRELAKPRRRNRTISKLSAKLLAVWGGLPEFAPTGAPPCSLFDFKNALTGAAKGDPDACQRVALMAAAIAPHLSVQRGPKASQASTAHQFLMTYVNSGRASSSYTWNVDAEDFTDPLTQATRTAFRDPDFDPRPASRRHKKRLASIAAVGRP